MSCYTRMCRQSILYVLRALDKLIISINGCFLHLCHVTCAYVLYYFASFKGVNQELLVLYRLCRMEQ